jgi:hypothetical protein
VVVVAAAFTALPALRLLLEDAGLKVSGWHIIGCGL